MEVRGTPAVHLRAAMQQRFHQPDQAGVVNLDPGDLGVSADDGQREALKRTQERRPDLSAKKNETNKPDAL